MAIVGTKKLSVFMYKGGVGKTMLACQLACHAWYSGLRVFFIDADDQGNSTAFFQRMQKNIGSVHILNKTVVDVAMSQNEAEALPKLSGTMTILPHDHETPITRLVENQSIEDEQGVKMFERVQINLGNLFKALDESYDFCVIDCPPSQDLRIPVLLGLSDAVICPTQYTQEALEGMIATVEGDRGIYRIRDEMTDGQLNFLGFLPNMTEKIPAQQANALIMYKEFGGVFFKNHSAKRGDSDIFSIPKRDALRIAQNDGVSIRELGKTNDAAKKTYQAIVPIFDAILQRIGAVRQKTKEEEEEDELKMLATVENMRLFLTGYMAGMGADGEPNTVPNDWA